ncbi:hypothetical protein SLS58_003949 [Diplodia intermedia]|uniref:DUF676 domain-containing protein n=1 Tax=Diplodia intermedia TaxID=856260 RepID=A0ABR3TV09_9PEZI
MAHSLGGIVVKAAIIAMEESTEAQDRANFQSLRSILLFGVPNHGMNIETLIPMIHESARRTLLYPLDESNSPTLREIGRKFLMATRNIPGFGSFYFYETMESPTAIMVHGQWQMNGPPAVLVSVSSATHGTPHDYGDHRVIPVNRTHSDLVKFTGLHDDVYQMVLDRLEVTLGDAQYGPQDCVQNVN